MVTHMDVFRFVIMILAIGACSWIIWIHRWLGVYIVGFILAAYSVERWSPRFGLHPLFAVLIFVVVGTYIGYRLFPHGALRRPSTRR